MDEIKLLLISAATLGVIHTLLGPDHYLPFIAMGRARKWTQTRTMWITFISGVGHVMGSVVLGMIGIAMGIGVSRLESIEANRAGIVGWMLIVFGVLYSAYGIIKYVKKGAHVHLPAFMRPKSIRHDHLHLEDAGKENKDAGSLTPWILFLIIMALTLFVYRMSRGKVHYAG